jgi:hypothetical protein
MSPSVDAVSRLSPDRPAKRSWCLRVSGVVAPSAPMPDEPASDSPAWPCRTYPGWQGFGQSTRLNVKLRTERSHDVCFGSGTDIGARLINVCFALKSGRQRPALYLSNAAWQCSPQSDAPRWPQQSSSLWPNRLLGFPLRLAHAGRSALFQKLLMGHPAANTGARIKIEAISSCCSIRWHPSPRDSHYGSESHIMASR